MLEKLNQEFLDLYTLHRQMVEQESLVLTALYLEKLGHLQLELLQKQTEAARLKMKAEMIQSAINRDEPVNLPAIEATIEMRLLELYARIAEHSVALDDAKKILSALLSEEDTLKLRDTYRLLCKRLHPDLHPNQSDHEKELFLKVQAAYDLKRLDLLQEILLALEEPDESKRMVSTVDQKRERVDRLQQQIGHLRSKIEKLKNSFPFDMADLIHDEDHLRQRRQEIRHEIGTCEEKIRIYQDRIAIMIG